MNLYRMFRAYMFEKSSLDPREPELRANENWRKIPMPKDSWTWVVIDTLVITVREKRHKRVVSGALDLENAEDLRKELESLRDKCIKGSGFYNAVWNRGWPGHEITSFDMWCEVVEGLKNHVPAPTGQGRGLPVREPLSDVQGVHVREVIA